MKNLRKTFVAMILCLTMFTAACLIILSSNQKPLASAYTGQAAEMSPTELFNATNTFEGSAISVSDVWGWKTHDNGDAFTGTSERAWVPLYEVEYNMNSRVNKPVMSAPQITVLTHGWNGGANNWSKKTMTNAKGEDEDFFAYDPDSLIEKLSDKAGGANIYWAKMNKPGANENNEWTGHWPFDLIDITYQTGLYKDSIHYCNDSTKCTFDNNCYSYIKESITDISKHIIIVFESYDSEDFNENVYYELNYMLSKVIYDIKIINGGILPKVNLIGHSRGGITNLMYALDHPDLVDSLISMGTPYFGSNIANLNNVPLSDMAIVFRNSNALDDITNHNKYKAYSVEWNSNYSRYNKIKATAIGADLTLAFVVQAITRNLPTALSEAIVAIEEAIMMVFNVSGDAVEAIMYQLLSELLEYCLPSSVVASWARFLIDEIDFSQSFGSTVLIRNDIAVQKESQLALSGSLSGVSDYAGFNRVERRFHAFDGTDFSKQSAGAPVFMAHALEPKDSQIIDWIINYSGIYVKLLFETAAYGDGLEIVGFNRDFKNFYYTGEINIPYQMYGLMIKSIGDFAFFEYSIKSVNIPFYVVNIGEFAFANCTNLSVVKFESYNNLKEIGVCAFMNCFSLTSIYIPRSIKKIDEAAFRSCVSLSKIEFVSYSFLESIGSNAFENCTSLQRINLPESLIKIGREAFYVSGLTFIEIPYKVKVIEAYTFAGCTELQIITFSKNSQLIEIENNAFNSCTNLISTIHSPFKIPSSVNKIAENAFNNCYSLESIIIPVLGQSYLKFRNCPKLSEIYYAGNNNFNVYDENNKRIDVYYYSEDKPAANGNTCWRYVNNTPKRWGDYEVSFYDSSSKATATHGCPMPKINLPSTKPMRDAIFCGYFSINGVKYYDGKRNSARLYDIEEDIMLYPRWLDPYSHKATLIEITPNAYPHQYGRFLIFSIDMDLVPGMKLAGIFGNDYPIYWNPLKDAVIIDPLNKTITIWIEALNATEASFLNIHNAIDIYFYYSNNITFDSKNGSNTFTQTNYGYFTEKPVEPVKDGYAFLYWALEGREYEEFNWDLSVDGDITLVAVWEFLYTPRIAFKLINNGTAYEVDIKNAIGDVIIPSSYKGLPVISVASKKPSTNYHIVKYPSITSVTLPESVTNIGDYAFYGCVNLTSITIPFWVTNIGISAFENCSSLTNITIPHSVRSIESNIFYGCTNLQNIIIPSSVTNIENEAFISCKKLTIYTEWTSRPQGWGDNWNKYNRPVVWGCTLSSDKTYVVSINKTETSISYKNVYFNIREDLYFDNTIFIAQPVRKGYVFLGWYDNLNFMGNCYTAAEIAVASNSVYYAKWVSEDDIISYKIIFNIAGWDGALPDIVVAEGEKINKPDISFPVEYYFIGWLLMPDLDGIDMNNEYVQIEIEFIEFDFDTAITSDLELMAVLIRLY